MKQILSFLVVLLVGLMAPPSLAAVLRDQDNQFLERYEMVRARLADDDLEGARDAASKITDRAAASMISRADSLNTARMGFKKLSTDAIALGSKQPGFVVFRCPMVEADWLQRTPQVSNPYLGRKMPTCGQPK